MGRLEMEELRRKLRLEHEGRVRVVFPYPYMLPTFECVPCAETMLWLPEQKWWACPECSYELTQVEALEISKVLIHSSARFKSDINRKRNRGLWTWLSEKLFGQQKRLPRSSS